MDRLVLITTPFFFSFFTALVSFNYDDIKKKLIKDFTGRLQVIYNIYSDGYILQNFKTYKL